MDKKTDQPPVAIGTLVGVAVLLAPETVLAFVGQLVLARVLRQAVAALHDAPPARQR